jgi:hypothetical protein
MTEVGQPRSNQDRSFKRGTKDAKVFPSLGRKSHLRALRVCVVNFRFSLKKFFHAQTDQAKCFAARIFARVEKRREQDCGFIT